MKLHRSKHIRRHFLAAAGLPFFLSSAVLAQTPVTQITIDASAQRLPISPLIYGVNFGTTEQLRGLNAPISRYGGNGTSCYNWQLNAWNHANDWYFESIADKSPKPGHTIDAFIKATKAAGAQPMVTVPMLGWVAKLGPDRATLSSFSVAKYGPQQKVDPYHSDSGNGVKPDGTNITGNDPNDANMPSTPAFQKSFVQHIISKWGTSAHNGVRYYIMDNEPSLWNSTHRDVHPIGETMDEELKDIIAYGSMVKSLDPGAQIVAPEEWGWPGYIYSGYDQQWRGAHNYQGTPPDRAAHGGMRYYPWLLQQLHQYQQKTGKRLLNVLTVHYYPQETVPGSATSTANELLRSRATRALWDPNYVDQSWINAKIMLIPRLKAWVRKYYPGTKIGITEYNFGASSSMNGATTQADVLGIFGREGLDLATRWTCPATTTPVYKAMQMYRNYDGKDSSFGSISVEDTVPDPDNLSSFAALRTSDHQMTVMLINKTLTGDTSVSVGLSHYKTGKTAQVWQLTSDNKIIQLANASVAQDHIALTLPAQSITLLVIPH